MTALTLVLAIAGLAALVMIGLFLLDLLRSDGYGRGSLPRSHRDPFDPHLYA